MNTVVSTLNRICFRYQAVSLFNVLNVLVNLLLLLFAVFILFRPPTDPDFGWHLKYGEYYFKNKQILTTNTFSYTMPDYQWVNTYWLFELLLYVFYSFFGSTFYSLFFSIMVGIFLLGFFKNLKLSLLVSTFSYILTCILLSSFNITVRPHVYSTVFMLYFLYALLYNPKLYKTLPLLFLLWVNIHADFVVALFIFGIFVFFQIIKMRYLDWKICLILLLSTLSTLINPYGLNLWLTLINELTLPVKSFVAEWSLLSIENISLSCFFYFYSGLAFVALSQTYKKFGLWYIILTVFFFVFSIKAVYFLRIFYIFSSFCVFVFLQDLMSTIYTEFKTWFDSRSKELTAFLLFFCLLLVFSTTPMFVENIILSQDISLWASKAHYPYKAIQFIKVQKPTGNMLNFYDWGGFLIWQLPEYKTFVDGRMTSWHFNNKYFMSDYYKITRFPEEYQQLANTYISEHNITWVLDKKDSVIGNYLLANKKWHLIYSDEISEMYAREN